MAFSALKLDKEVVKEKHRLNNAYSEAQLALEEIKRSEDDLNSLKKYFQEMIQIDIQLEHLYKTVVTSLKKVNTKALTTAQARGHSVRMTQVINQILAIEQRAEKLITFQTEDSKKMRHLESDLLKNIRRLRYAVNNAHKYVKQTKKTTDRISNLAVEAGQLAAPSVGRGGISKRVAQQAKPRLWGFGP